ncbi:hypothetical protein ABB07_00400 [Streptomyces incarnatus]|uniref:Uncharacterized protein n=1 Tax=Streptomyces incarnatus TaxID=665007 RepID=A0ABM5TCH2_9ACTN|nr:hypothetical protein [Streptomyces incarnatus]AKJ08563.1 hypothetical protein ABB07_00400 [Streptomyces incarnatus]
MNNDSAEKIPERLVDTVEAGPGGAVTDEVGVITSELTVATTRNAAGRAHIVLQYAGAEKRYTLTGSPAPLPSNGLHALHQDVLERVRHGGGTEAPNQRRTPLSRPKCSVSPRVLR